MRRLYIRFKSLVNDSVYSFGRAALLLLVEVWNHTVPVRERRRIRVKCSENEVCCNRILNISQTYSFIIMHVLSSLVKLLCP